MKYLGILFAFLAILYSSRLIAGEVEKIEDESGITIFFEKWGDEDQIKGFRKDVLPETKKILESISSDLGFTKGKTKAALYFFGPDRYYHEFPEIAEKKIPAFFNGVDSVYARADNEINYELKKTLRHECTHLLIAQNVGKIPAWLNEGLAVYEERKISPIDPTPNNHEYNTLVIAKQDNKVMTLDMLEKNSVFLRHLGTIPAGDAYTTAYVAVYEMIQKAGIDGMRQYLSNLGKGKNAKEEFGPQFGISYDKFNEYLVQVSEKKS